MTSRVLLTRIEFRERLADLGAEKIGIVAEALVSPGLAQDEAFRLASDDDGFVRGEDQDRGADPEPDLAGGLRSSIRQAPRRFASCSVRRYFVRKLVPVRSRYSAA